MCNQQEHICDFLLLYTAGDGTEAERRAFKKHLSSCSSCSGEMQQLAELWQAMPLLAEETEVPGDMKADVLRGIFGKEEGGNTDNLKSGSVSVKIRTFLRGRKKLWAASLAVVLGAFILAVGYSLWPIAAPRKETTAVLALPAPAQVLKTYMLSPVDRSMPNASGTVWVLQGEEKNQVVVHLKGLSKTTEDQVYQVWLIHAGKRYNCGTLLADTQGTGVLTYPIKKEVSFEAIGVTLEPDAKGTQPRGKKVLGS